MRSAGAEALHQLESLYPARGRLDRLDVMSDSMRRLADSVREYRGQSIDPAA
jgi:hypothetical protein